MCARTEDVLVAMSTLNVVSFGFLEESERVKPKPKPNPKNGLARANPVTRHP